MSSILDCWTNPFKKKIISTVLSSKANRNKFIHLNPFLSNPGSVSNKDELIQNNMDAVLFNYNQSKYREKLIGIYKKVTRDNVCQKIDKKMLLSEFLRLDNFSLLKWCDNAWIWSALTLYRTPFTTSDVFKSERKTQRKSQLYSFWRIRHTLHQRFGWYQHCPATITTNAKSKKSPG